MRGCGDPGVLLCALLAFLRFPGEAWPLTRRARG